MTEAKPTVDLGYPTEAHGRIPSFADIEEEAAFWDTHDLTDFLDESWPVEMTSGPKLAERGCVTSETIILSTATGDGPLRA